MCDRVLGLDLLHHLQVVGVGFGEGFENLVLELVGEFALNDLGQYLALS